MLLRRLALACLVILLALAPLPARAVYPEMRTWRSEALGLSLDYPAELWLVDDPKVTGRVLEEVQTRMGKTAVPVGIQFFLFRFRPGTVRVNPNLNLTTATVPADDLELTPEEVVRQGLEEIPHVLPGATMVGGVEPVAIRGRTFLRATFEFEQQGVRFRSRQYVYYDAPRSLVLHLTITDDAETFDRNTRILDDVVRTVTLK